MHTEQQETYSDLTVIRADPARGRASCVHPEWAICLGGASCVWDDLLAFEALYGQQWDGLVIAVNDIGCHWPRDLDHWVTLHSDKFGAWLPQRAAYGFSTDYVTWCRWYRPDIDVDYRIKPWGGGSSGMLGAQVGIALGCSHVVLLGIPMTQTPHFAETLERFHSIWIAATAHWRAWTDNRGQFGDHVRSMSGKTRDLFGAPTLEWLQGRVAS